MDYTVKFIKACTVDGVEYAVGDIATVNDAAYKELKGMGAVEDYTKPETTPEQDMVAAVRDAVKAALADAKTKDTTKDTKSQQIIVGDDRLSRDPKGGFEHFGHFAQSIYLAGKPGSAISKDAQKLETWNKVAKTYIEESDPAQGGYLIPAEFKEMILDKAHTEDALETRCWNIPIQRAQLEIPAINETSRADGSRWGGVLGYWLDEGAQKQLSKPHYRKIQLKLKKLALLSVATDEMLEDSPFTIGTMLTTVMGKEIKFLLNEAIYNGTGVAQPLGFMASPSLITIPRQVALRVTGIDLLNMWARLYAPSRGNAIWLCGQDTEPQIQMANFPGDTPLSEFPVMMPAGGFSQAPYSTIFGRPLIPCEHSALLGTTGDIALVDLSQYILATKASGVKFDTSIHLYFDYDMTAFRAVYRVDGQPWWLSDLTPYNGGPTQSPFVVLGDIEQN